MGLTRDDEKRQGCPPTCPLSVSKLTHFFLDIINGFHTHHSEKKQLATTLPSIGHFEHFGILSFTICLFFQGNYDLTVSNIFPLKLYCNFFFFFVFLGLHPWHMEVPRLGVKLELQLQACATATATEDLSYVCTLHHSSYQCQMLNSLSKARD